MSMGFGWLILVLQVIIFIPTIALIVLIFYLIILAIKALKIYIRKNS